VKWSGELSKAGDTILHQHAIQGDITPVQQAVWYVNVFFMNLILRNMCRDKYVQSLIFCILQPLHLLYNKIYEFIFA
jgi:hypothetical protein